MGILSLIKGMLRNNNSVIFPHIALMMQFYAQEIMMSVLSVKFLNTQTDKITVGCILYTPSVKIHF
jgi:hypothetical protein